VGFGCQGNRSAVLGQVASISLKTFQNITVASEYGNIRNYSIKDGGCKRSPAIRKKNVMIGLRDHQIGLGIRLGPPIALSVEPRRSSIAELDNHEFYEVPNGVVGRS
jgi:hypothetical protein